MDFILLLHPAEYDTTRKRFKSTAFRPSSGDGGISVVECDCIEREGGCPCNHARRFYPSVSSEPPMFWRFSDSVLPQGINAQQQTTAEGDICHHNLIGFTASTSRSFWKSKHAKSLSAFTVCDESDKVVPLTEGVLAGIVSSYEASLPE